LVYRADTADTAEVRRSQSSHIAALLAGRSVLGAPPSMLGGLRVRPGSAPN
jgi:hypothetical protein